MQIWRNWQTRTVQVRVSHDMRVRVSLSAPEMKSQLKTVAFLFMHKSNEQFRPDKKDTRFSR